MPEYKISDLTEYTSTLDGTELLEISKVIAGNLASRSLSISTFTTHLSGSFVALSGDSQISGSLFATDGYVSGGTDRQTTRSSTTDVTPAVQVVGTGTNPTAILLGRWSNNTNPSRFYFVKSRGTSVGTFNAITTNDQLGEITFAGSDGTKFNEGARIQAIASSPSGADYTPTAVRIFTSDGSAAPAARVTVNPDGTIMIANSTTVFESYGVLRLRSYTVGTLPSSAIAGRVAWASDCRVFDGAGTREGAGAGTGGMVTSTGSAWVVAGTNVAAAA